MGYPLQAIGVPKTVDNDLPFTDTCPGFGSVAKYVATSTKEAALDVESMCETSTKVFVSVMGRHAGWIAAAGALAQEQPGDAPHIILLPEVAFNKKAFLAKVKWKPCVEKAFVWSWFLRVRATLTKVSGRVRGRQGCVWPCAAGWRSTYNRKYDQGRLGL